MTTLYTMTARGLAVSSAGVALPIPVADVATVAPPFLADGETLEIRPETSAAFGRRIAYGVIAGRFRRLPIVVAGYGFGVGRGRS